jgi:sugar lactone lactonase YvrE
MPSTKGRRISTSMSVDRSWDVAVPAGAEVAERPLWDERHGCLVWVEVTAGRLHRYRPVFGDDVLAQLEVPLGAAGLRSGGGYVLAAGDGFHLVDQDGRREEGPFRPSDMAANVRFNDGACDPAGRFWAGTVALDSRRGGGALYRFDPDRSIHRVLGHVTESNGIGWSPDGETLYYVDSGEPRIRAFEFDAEVGSLGRVRDLVLLNEDEIPDGLTVDEEGCVWVALWGAGTVRRYSSSGVLLERLPVPVSRVSCPGFGGPDLADLYVTTAWEGMSVQERVAQPLAGHILRTRAGVKGRVASRFGG